jgi:hypothetical protein
LWNISQWDLTEEGISKKLRENGEKLKPFLTLLKPEEVCNDNTRRKKAKRQQNRAVKLILRLAAELKCLITQTYK